MERGTQSRDMRVRQCDNAGPVSDSQACDRPVFLQALCVRALLSDSIEPKFSTSIGILLLRQIIKRDTRVSVRKDPTGDIHPLSRAYTQF